MTDDEAREQEGNVCAGSVRVAYPLFQAGGGGSTPTPALKARSLWFDRCSVVFAIDLVRLWHSRLPKCQRGPWQFAFNASHDGITYAVALWNNPSTRSLPSHWLELRRMAVSDDAPTNTASRFLAWMVRYFRVACPERERCLAYQDTEVHAGGIYRACGWHQAFVGTKRRRDRSKMRAGTQRAYRSNLNSDVVDSAAKVRWECPLNT